MRPIAVMIVALAAWVAPAAADGGTQVWQYTGHNDAAQECLAASADCAEVLVLSGCATAVCDYVTGSDLDLVLEDASGLAVGASFLVARGCGASAPGCVSFAEVISGRFCGSATGIRLPEGSDYLFVVPDGPLHGPQDCAATGTPGVATTGTLTIRTR